MVLVMILVLVVSFSVVALAEEDGKATNNNAGVEILVEDGEGEISFLPAVEDTDAEESGNTEYPTNPILVAGS